LNFSEAVLLPLSNDNSQVQCIVEEKQIPVLQVNTQSRKTCPKSMGGLQHWRIQQQNTSGLHHDLQTAFSKLSAGLPAQPILQEHCRAQHKLLAHGCYLLTPVGLIRLCILAAEISIPTVEALQPADSSDATGV